MTTHAPPEPRWMSLPELAAATGLTGAQISQFVPATPTPEGPRFNSHQTALARVVRNLTDAGAPAAAIHTAVADLSQRPYGDVLAAADKHLARPRRSSRGKRTALAAGAIAALLIAGLIGGAIGATTNRHDQATPPAAAPQTITVTEPLNPTIPTRPDPVCAEWAHLNDDYRAKRADWVKTDPDIPAGQWSAEQRALSMAVIPVMKAEAADMRRLADKAADPVLRSMLQMEAMYMDVYAGRLPTYTPPDDQRLWVAATDFGNAVNSMCYATGPR
ncbi:hypothetical protein QRB41_26470 [Mycobacterium avium subsp. hominissuis]|uniref:hypothetical protein n=1 Tax=Mycobacterium avium TaxID=1764 RepID=UPI002666A478|nr:hypothetical protein [Mycobacterium avium]MDO2386875.1 hypothetical protein [Mycobacterium avium subsp. hominissuis]